MRRKLLFVMLMLPFAFLSVAGQTGGVKGKVKNLNGDGISGATITARLDGKDIRSTRSSSKGDFQLDGLSDGTYNIVFDARGYSAGVKYGVEVKHGKIRDLGGNLILMVDRGTRVILRGSVFYKEGHSAAGAKVVIERLNGDGSTRKLGETIADHLGEFSFSQPEGAAKLRITATLRNGKGSKEIDVDSAMIYRFSVTLDSSRGDN